MKLPKAIEILEHDLEDKVMPHKQGVREAEQLGIEALKQIQQIRVYAKELFLPKLPGETES